MKTRKRHRQREILYASGGSNGDAASKPAPDVQKNPAFADESGLRDNRWAVLFLFTKQTEAATALAFDFALFDLQLAEIGLPADVDLVPLIFDGPDGAVV